MLVISWSKLTKISLKIRYYFLLSCCKVFIFAFEKKPFCTALFSNCDHETLTSTSYKVHGP